MSKLQWMGKDLVVLGSDQNKYCEERFPHIQFRFVEEKPEDSPYLQWQGERLLFYATQAKESCLEIDFLAASYQNRRKSFRGKSEPLIKAIASKTKDISILDATAGLGRESYLMATYGFNVIACEASIYLYLCLKNAEINLWKHLNIGPDRQRLRFEFGDFYEYLERSALRPDVIYLDPMFPASNASAKVKKEMQILKSLDLSIRSAEEMLQLARTKASRRVVLKRPRNSAILDADACAEYYENDTIRYEVYFPL